MYTGSSIQLGAGCGVVAKFVQYGVVRQDIWHDMHVAYATNLCNACCVHGMPSIAHAEGHAAVCNTQPMACEFCLFWTAFVGNMHSIVGNMHPVVCWHGMCQHAVTVAIWSVLHTSAFDSILGRAVASHGTGLQHTECLGQMPHEQPGVCCQLLLCHTEALLWCGLHALVALSSSFLHGV